jgi:hypothetical protein
MPPEYRIVAKARIDPKRITGKTVHRSGGSILPAPDHLLIAEIGSGDGFYLLYFDENDNQLTDTWHQSVELAMEQAHYEFGLLPSEWCRY